MKKYLIIIMMAFVPSLLMAQTAGGVIKHPSKKKKVTTSKSISKNGVVLKTYKIEINQVIQNIINNMVFVERGTFIQGEKENHTSNDPPAREVTLHSFYLCKYEVTQEEWESIMDNNPSYYRGAKRPVESVSWDKCQKFIEKLNYLSGKEFRMPSEAEWEFAARGGNYSKNCKYSGSNSIGDVAWFEFNSNGETHEVGQKIPNELGFYDMSGNVSEWCQTGMHLWGRGPVTDPKGPDSPYERILRGGSYNSPMSACCPSFRSWYGRSESGSDRIGFRLAMSINE